MFFCSSLNYPSSKHCNYSTTWCVMSQTIECTGLDVFEKQQLRTPVRIPPLSHLRSFTVKHARMLTRDHTNRLCKWIRVVVSTSPIECLRVICDSDSEDEPIAGSPSFDNIIAHLVNKHALTLRLLDIPKSFIGVTALTTLCQRCVHLEELSAAIGKNALVSISYICSFSLTRRGGIENIRGALPRITAPSHSFFRGVQR